MYEINRYAAIRAICHTISTLRDELNCHLKEDPELAAVFKDDRPVCSDCLIMVPGEVTEVDRRVAGDLANMLRPSENLQAVTLAYDGDSYDWFSYEAYVEGPAGTLIQTSDTVRQRLRDELRRVGLHFEDNNTWSLSVYE